MLYLRCPTCRTILANKQLPFEEGIKKICSKEGLSEVEKGKLKEKLLDELEIRRICCRMRVLTYISQIDIII